MGKKYRFRKVKQNEFQGEHEADSSENHPMLPQRYIAKGFILTVLIFINKTNKHWPYLLKLDPRAGSKPK